MDGIATDAQGNLYASGKFEVTLETPGGRVQSEGGANIMVARYFRSGELDWIERFGSTDADNIFDVATDDEQNAILSGMFTGVVDFGDTTLRSASLDEPDAVVFKVSPTGEVLWAIRAGGVGADGANEVSISETGRWRGRGDSLSGSELELDLDGGPLFPLRSTATVVVESGDDVGIELKAEDAGPALLRFTEDGELAEVVATPSGLELGRASEIARSGVRVYVDSPVENPGTLKDARILAYDLSTKDTLPEL